LRDLKDNFQMDYRFDRAENGNIALIGELDLSKGKEFTLGLAFGSSPHSSAAKLCQSFSLPFELQRRRYIEEWKSAHSSSQDLKNYTGDSGRLLSFSESILLAHEDKIFQGAFVASMSIPWGETRGDEDLGGYHLVWPRDLVQTASALLAIGHREDPLRALVWLACIQRTDGLLPQNSWVTGDAYWSGKALGEVAAPDREPVGPYRLLVPARRARHFRFNNLDDPAPIPVGTSYSSLIESDVPVVVQLTRLDSRQSENALLSTIAFPCSD